MHISRLIFDLDGTLIDSAGDVQRAVNYMLSRFNCEPLSLSEVKGMIGEGAVNLIGRALTARSLDGDRAATALAHFMECYEDESRSVTRLYPGVVETLETLRNRGTGLALCTNKLTRLTMPVLERFAISDYFDCIVAGDTLPFRKPDPRVLMHIMAKRKVSASECAMVGDSEIDAATAHAAKIPFVLMTYGYRRGLLTGIQRLIALDDFAALTQVISA